MKTLALASLLTLASAALAAPPKYRLEEIPSLGTGQSIDYLRVNEAGTVLVRHDTFGGPVGESGWWSGPGQYQKATLPDFIPSYITDAETLVGTYPYREGFVNYQTAVLRRDGSFTQIVPPGNVGQYQTLGAVAPNGGYTGTNDFSRQVGYRIGTGTTSDYTVNNGAGILTRFAGMNSAGVVALTTAEGTGLDYNTPWVVRGSKGTRLALEAGGFIGNGLALDVDSRGRVLGQLSSSRSGTEVIRTVVYGGDDAPTLIPVPDGLQMSSTAFNAGGTILSHYQRFGFETVGVYTPEGTTLWADMIEDGAPNWQYLKLQDVSDSGYIVGRGRDRANTNIVHAFRLVPLNPVPEPASLTALGLGALALLRRRRTDGGKAQGVTPPASSGGCGGR